MELANGNTTPSSESDELIADNISGAPFEKAKRVIEAIVLLSFISFANIAIVGDK